MDLSLVFSFLGAVVSTLLAISSLISLVIKKRAEKEFIDKVKTRELESLIAQLEKVKAVQDQGDPQKQEQLIQLQNQLVELLNKELSDSNTSRKYISDAIKQPSIVGKERYLRKLVERIQKAKMMDASPRMSA